MSQPLTIAVTGPGADRALTELLAIPGVQGEAAPGEGGPVMRDGGLLVAIGAVVGIVGGVVEITDKIIEWREKWRARPAAQRLSVVIEDGRGNRLALDSANPEQITSLLQALSQ